ncbi:MAG: hypothetical protein Q9165_008351 [Trypethelium subeluteriae]
MQVIARGRRRIVQLNRSSHAVQLHSWSKSPDSRVLPEAKAAASGEPRFGRHDVGELAKSLRRLRTEKAGDAQSKAWKQKPSLQKRCATPLLLDCGYLIIPACHCVAILGGAKAECVDKPEAMTRARPDRLHLAVLLSALPERVKEGLNQQLDGKRDGIKDEVEDANAGEKQGGLLMDTRVAPRPDPAARPDMLVLPGFIEIHDDSWRDRALLSAPDGGSPPHHTHAMKPLDVV